MSDSRDLLQHPRRNLGNRYRSTAQKFAKLAKADPSRASENMAWAEQNARQAILHDFTDERNWRYLAELKVINDDAEDSMPSWKTCLSSWEEIQKISTSCAASITSTWGGNYWKRLLPGTHWTPMHGGRSSQALRWIRPLQNSPKDAGVLIFGTNGRTSFLDGVWNACVPRATRRCSLI